MRRGGRRPGSVDVRVELDDDGATLRAIATGMVGLESGALPGSGPGRAAEAAALAGALGRRRPGAVGRFWVAAGPAEAR